MSEPGDTGAELVKARVASPRVALDRPLQSGQLLIRSRDYCCLQVVRADGVVGEAYVLTRGLPVAETLNKLVLPRMFGTTDDSGVDALVGLRNVGWSGLISRAVGLVELARLDAAAKAAGLSVRNRLHPGVVSERQPGAVVAIGYTSPGDDPAEHDVAQAEQAAELGAQMVKLMGGAASVEQDLARVARVVAAVGNVCGVALDLNGAWTPDQAAHWLPRLRDAGAVLAEDPYPYETGSHPNLAPGSPVPLACGEVLASPLEISAILTTAPPSYLRPDVTLLGGPALFAEACQLARNAGVKIFPHYWPEYHVQLLAPTGFGDLVECTLPGSPWFGQERFMSGRPELQDGRLDAAARPGFGLSFDWRSIARMAIDVKVVM